MVSQSASPTALRDVCNANQGTIGLVLTWILLTIGIIVVSLRLYVRLAIRHNIGWDDYTALASLIIGIVAGGFFTKMITSGMGRHVLCLPPQSVISMLEFSAISEALNVIGIGVVKISVCLSLLRVVERGRRRISQFLWFLLVFVAVTHLALAMTFFLHCRPLAALWNPQVQGQCLSTHTTVLAGYVGFAVDVVTDLVCAGIPLFVVHRLQMSFQTRLVLCMLMGLGVFTAGCAIAKAITLRGVFADDYTWGFTKPATWAAVEQFVGIIIASIPALRPLSNTFFEKSRSLSRGLSRMFPYPKRYFSRGSKIVSSSSHDSSQRQQQQPLEYEPSTQESKNSKKKLLPWYRFDEERISHNTEPSPIIAVDEKVAQDCDEDVDVEREFTGECLPEKRNTTFLFAWTPPNIEDRRSAIFSIPFLIHDACDSLVRESRAIATSNRTYLIDRVV